MLPRVLVAGPPRTTHAAQIWRPVELIAPPLPRARSIMMSTIAARATRPSVMAPRRRIGILMRRAYHRTTSRRGRRVNRTGNKTGYEITFTWPGPTAARLSGHSGASMSKPPGIDSNHSGVRCSVRRRVLIACSALVMAGACTSARPTMEPPTITLDAVRVGRIADAKADVSLRITLANHNDLELAIL